MSEAKGSVGPQASVAPAPKLNAIQIIEQEIFNWTKQREDAAKRAEEAIANVHAVEGAIQGAQKLLARLKAEAAVAAHAEKVGEKA